MTELDELLFRWQQGHNISQLSRSLGQSRQTVRKYLQLARTHGLSDEFHQQFVPGRFPGVDDLVFDTLGGLLAVVIDRARHRWTSRRSRANTRAGDQ